MNRSTSLLSVKCSIGEHDFCPENDCACHCHRAGKLPNQYGSPVIDPMTDLHASFEQVFGGGRVSACVALTGAIK